MEVDAGVAPSLADRSISQQHDPSNRYHRIKLVGAGTYGRVYKAKDTAEDKTVALKEIRLDADEQGIPSTALREIALLRELDHPNVIKCDFFRLYGMFCDRVKTSAAIRADHPKHAKSCRLHDILHSESRLTLVFEYAEKDLKDYMNSQRDLLMREPFLAKFIVWQMLHGLDYIHRRRIIHRDLKPQNILINVNQTVVKLADFGLARVFGIPVRTYTHEVVTLWYRPPEILLGVKVYSTPVDMWSVGCIMAELISGGEPLFPGENEISQLFKIFQILGTPSEDVWPGVSELPDYLKTFPQWHKQDLNHVLKGRLDPDGLDLLQQMLKYQPGERITPLAALRHKYFQDLHNFLPGTRLPIYQ